MEQRHLNSSEITALDKNGCRAEDWSKVLVKNGFNPDWLHNVTFSGEVTLGDYSQIIEVEQGCMKKCGLYDSYIQNCTI
ncbi:MAG: DUF4954 family protein, partial [Candidatus Neomarinimicrobiota bacterium]